MNANSVVDIEELCRAVLSGMPGWRLLQRPEAFGWAPDHHFRAELVKGCQTEKAVIRRSWTVEGYRVELFLYRSALPGLAIRTPKLLGTFEVDPHTPGWMILEDLGTEQARRDCLDHREAFLSILGRLHGQGQDLIRSKSLEDSPLPRFAQKRCDYHKWRALLTTASATAQFGVEGWMVVLLDTIWDRLSQETATLLHGDTDFSNCILSDEGVALVDWEKAAIGPPSVDMGRVVEATESIHELEAYWRGYCETADEKAAMGQVRYWADLGDAYNCLRWVCYYVQETMEGRKPSSEWRGKYYEPCLSRLHALHERREDWLGYG